jgi:alkylhydroperoxidase family enzyme
LILSSGPASAGLFLSYNAPMSRLPRLTKDEVSPEVRELYLKVGAQRGNVPNMFRVYAHRPEILQTMVAHLSAITNSGTVPVKTKELVATLVSRINRCIY